MKRKKPPIGRTSSVAAALWPRVIFILLITLALLEATSGAIVPPPWSDPAKNPCASMPGGWQLLYWPPLRQCFKIFTIGHPCPDTMELSPTAVGGGGRKLKEPASLGAPSAECRCPPGTALSALTQQCHRIFERGPCTSGQYFSPVSEEDDTAAATRRTHTKRLLEANRLGSCQTPYTCPEAMAFWPKDGKCYTQYTKGPCVKGKLLIMNGDGLGECQCENTGALRDYYYAAEETCHQHYTKGPCSTPGHLFLPGGRCDCRPELPHYHADYQMCFELNTPGPCPRGHVFNVPDNDRDDDDDDEVLQSRHAACQCKEGYVPWADGHCYRLYTRGPCAANEFLINATACVRNFCGKSRLYFPDQKSCYRIGSQGPCALQQLVVFDFTARPSVDGISYNGMCGCAGVITNLDQQCSNDAAAPAATAAVSTCESAPGMVELNGECYKLYSRGPCGPGQWLEPLKAQTAAAASHRAGCACRPGYTQTDGGPPSSASLQRCNAPNVGLARYLTTQRRQGATVPPQLSTADYNFHTFPFFV